MNDDRKELNCRMRKHLQGLIFKIKENGVVLTIKVQQIVSEKHFGWGYFFMCEVVYYSQYRSGEKNKSEDRAMDFDNFMNRIYANKMEPVNYQI